MVAHGCAGATIHGMLIMDGANRQTVVAVVAVPNMGTTVEAEIEGEVAKEELGRPTEAVATRIVEYSEPGTRSGEENLLVTIAGEVHLISRCSIGRSV